MLNLKDITVRLGGRTIIDGASAALPPGARIGLIGRNGAGKSTLVRVIAGLLEPDTGSAEMPRGTRLGYIAQETPGGSATPFETVLAADTERAALLHQAEHSHDPHRLGEIHERLNVFRIDPHHTIAEQDCHLVEDVVVVKLTKASAVGGNLGLVGCDLLLLLVEGGLLFLESRVLGSERFGLLL